MRGGGGVRVMYGPPSAMRRDKPKSKPKPKVKVKWYLTSTTHCVCGNPDCSGDSQAEWIEYRKKLTAWLNIQPTPPKECCIKFKR
jgi:hypothetical protein